MRLYDSNDLMLISWRYNIIDQFNSFSHATAPDA
jgi:hypothetical protein